MATSAFKSTTRRTSIGDAHNSTIDDSSYFNNRNSTAHSRSRSLSRFSRRIQDQDVFSEDVPRGKFVNTVRGSGFPEISLDDQVIELFDSSGDRGRLASRKDDVRGRNDGRDSGGRASVRRGRSVSRQGAKNNGGWSSGDGKGAPENNNNNNSRRRRSVSVVRHHISDSESDLDLSQHSSNCSSKDNKIGGHGQMPLSHRSTAPNHIPALRRSVSQKDLKYYDGYLSQSSTLTDDEGRDAQCSKNGIERTIQAVYAQNKVEHPTGDDLNGGLCDVMRKEIRHAVEEIRMELELAMTKTKTNDNCMRSKNLDSLQTVSIIRKNYTTKLEQSEKRKQDLLAEIMLEEQRNRELSKIVKELLPDPKDSVVENRSRARKRSNDRNRMSKRLTEEAEKYIEDFISNVEDTDISSVDGERSDTSSTFGGITKKETFQSPAISKPFPVEMDGVVLPWLQWETTNDTSSHSCRTKTKPHTTPKTKCWDASQESLARDLSYSTSSRGSCSPGVIDGSSINFGEDKVGSKYGQTDSYQSQFQFLPNGKTRLRLDVDDYLKFQKEEDLLVERLRQQQRINSGGLILCNPMFH